MRWTSRLDLWDTRRFQGIADLPGHRHRRGRMSTHRRLVHRCRCGRLSHVPRVVRAVISRLERVFVVVVDPAEHREHRRHADRHVADRMPETLRVMQKPGLAMVTERYCRRTHCERRASGRQRSLLLPHIRELSIRVLSRWQRRLGMQDRCITRGRDLCRPGLEPLVAALIRIIRHGLKGIGVTVWVGVR